MLLSEATPCIMRPSVCCANKGKHAGVRHSELHAGPTKNCRSIPLYGAIDEYSCAGTAVVDESNHM